MFLRALIESSKRAYKRVCDFMVAGAEDYEDPYVNAHTATVKEVAKPAPEVQPVQEAPKPKPKAPAKAAVKKNVPAKKRAPKKHPK